FIWSFQHLLIGGYTTTIIYKNWQLNSYVNDRMGNMYYGLLQTYGRRVEKDVWSTENPNGKFPQPRSGGVTTTDYSAYMNYTKGNMVAKSNMALSYNISDKRLMKVAYDDSHSY